MQHGLISECEAWIYSGVNSPVANLVEAGFDVWLGNNRGNIYSKKNSRMNKDEEKFWDFSFVEMGRFDLPAMIDHIREQTGQDKVIYMGHSLGTTQMISALSENKGIQNKISTFMAFAPIARIDHTRTEFL
jgi:pimeloyl-ACP methyl ester carboxylesterase